MVPIMPSLRLSDNCDSSHLWFLIIVAHGHMSSPRLSDNCPPITTPGFSLLTPFPPPWTSV